VEPRIPGNTGSIARTCAVTGAALHLVRPFGFEISDAKLKRAGLDYWDKLDIFEYPDIQAFFAAHPQALPDPYFYFTAKTGTLYTEVQYPPETFLIFGREDRGLDDALLAAHPERCVRIPMRETLRCLNLSNSVAVAAYEVLRQWDFDGLTRDGRLAKASWETPGSEGFT
jgi:tRNA (cytidine/uridine-2'-O-)-methyltransferase